MFDEYIEGPVKIDYVRIRMLAVDLAREGCSRAAAYLKEMQPPAPQGVTAFALPETDVIEKMVAERSLKPLKYPSLAAILRAVAIATRTPVNDLVSARRAKPIVRARMIFYAAARQLTAQSLPAIGRVVGNKDHSTVHHGLQKFARHPQHFEPEYSRVIACFPREPAP